MTAANSRVAGRTMDPRIGEAIEDLSIRHRYDRAKRGSPARSRAPDIPRPIAAADVAARRRYLRVDGVAAVHIYGTRFRTIIGPPRAAARVVNCEATRGLGGLGGVYAPRESVGGVSHDPRLMVDNGPYGLSTSVPLNSCPWNMWNSK